VSADREWQRIATDSVPANADSGCATDKAF